MSECSDDGCKEKQTDTETDKEKPKEKIFYTVHTPRSNADIVVRAGMVELRKTPVDQSKLPPTRIQM